jgi:uncharacterized membrane protein YkoI
MRARLPAPVVSLAAALALTLAVAAGARADDDDHDQARRAREAGDVLPLATVRDRVAADLGGRIVGIELERQHGAYVYEFKMIMPDGRLVELEVDARTAAVLGREVD